MVRPARVHRARPLGLRLRVVVCLVVFGCEPGLEAVVEGDDGSWPDAGVGVVEASTGEAESMSGPVPPGYLMPPDAWYSGGECDIWGQNCPPGEKCMPWANDGGGAWNATRCTPVPEDPGQLGDSCRVEGSGAAGVDDCDLRLMCWDVDPSSLGGTCVEMCLGSENSPHCADPDTQCTRTGEGVLILCLPTCDPLGAACPDGQVCCPVGWDFVCAPDAGGDHGALGDPCEYLNVCDPGLVCLSSEFVAGCLSSVACCTPYCDLNAADECPRGMDCVAWYEEGQAPPGHDDVGVCILPGGQ